MQDLNRKARGKIRLWRRGYLWVTLAFFLISLAGQWVLAWFAYVDDQQARRQPVRVGEYAVQTSRDVLENWQSEFLQLIWQVAGLAFLLYVGSPQSREGDERKEAKLDQILRQLDPQNAERILGELERRYPKK